MSVCAWHGCDVALPRTGQRGRPLKWCETHRHEIYLVRKRAESSDNVNLVCAETECDRSVRARGVCNMHYKQQLRAEGRIVQQPWNDRRRNNHYRRKARLGGGTWADVKLSDVIAHGGLVCGICAEPVDMDVKWPDPFSPSLDHIVPLSRGGSHVLENCQLAHLRCNISKGATVA